MPTHTHPITFAPQFLPFGAGAQRWEMPYPGVSDLYTEYLMAKGLPFPVGVLTCPARGFWPKRTIRICDTCQMTGAYRVIHQETLEHTELEEARARTEHLLAELITDPLQTGEVA